MDKIYGRRLSLIQVFVHCCICKFFAATSYCLNQAVRQRPLEGIATNVFWLVAHCVNVSWCFKNVVTLNVRE